MFSRITSLKRINNRPTIHKVFSPSRRNSLEELTHGYMKGHLWQIGEAILSLDNEQKN
jgi:hypothetical protein